jgi:hypothetical protein
MDLAGQSTARPAHVLRSVPRNTGTMLVHADDGGIDHLHSRIVSGGQNIHNPVPDASPPPADEAIVTGCMGSIETREITPRRPRPQDPEDAIEDTPIVYTGNAARFVR